MTDAELSATQAHLVAGAAREGPTAASPVELEGEHVELERQLSDAAEELKRLDRHYCPLSCLLVVDIQLLYWSVCAVIG